MAARRTEDVGLKSARSGQIVEQVQVNGRTGKTVLTDGNTDKQGFFGHGSRRCRQGNGGAGINISRPSLDVDPGARKIRGHMTGAGSAPNCIPDYVLVRQIGGGSYGDVWLARGITGVFRAIKIVWRDRFADVRPYEREFEGITRFAAISLREPSQLALLHAGRNDAAGFFYYVMELADDARRGRDIDPTTYTPLTLKEYAQRSPHLRSAEVVALGVQLARALASLHAAGLVHRDIKPSNIILVGGVPKLADVGLVAAASAQLTFVGTEGFVPPEGPGAAAADVYSLGKVLYELATGLDRNDFPRLPDRLAGWPDQREFLELNEVLLRACEPDQRRRYADAAALLDELLLLQAGKSVRRLRAAELRVTRALRVAAVLALVAVVAGAGMSVERRRADREMARRTVAEAERDALARRSVYAATLVRAQEALDQANYDSARQWLHRVGPRPGEEDLRGFEWRVLAREAAGDPAEVTHAGEATLLAARYSPDETLLALHDAEHVVWLWDPARQNVVRRIAGVYQLVGFSADGRWILGLDGNIAPQRWATATGEPDGPTHREAGNRPLAAWGRDDLLVFTDSPAGGALGRAPHQLRLWSLAEKRERWSIPLAGTGGQEGGDFYRCAVSPDGSYCALALIFGRMQRARWRLLLVDLRQRQIIRDEPLAARPGRLEFDPEGRQLACAWSDSGEVQILELDRGQWRPPFPTCVNQPSALAFTADGCLAVAGRGQAVYLYPAAGGALVRELRGMPSGRVELVAMRHTPKLTAAGNHGEARTWALAVPPERRVLPGFAAPPGGGRALRLSAEGRWLAATLDGEKIGITETLRGEAQMRIVPQTVAPIGFAREGDELWTLGAGAEVVRWRHSTGRSEASLSTRLKEGGAIAACASAGMNVAVAVDVGGRLSVLDLGQGKVVASIETGTPFPWWVAISPDGRFACLSGNDRRVRLWRLPAAQPVAVWEAPADVLNGAFSPDGSLLATITSAGRLELRAVAQELRLVASVDTGAGVLQDVVFHPVEKRLFLAGQGRLVHVLDMRDWSELTRFAVDPGNTTRGAVVRLAFSADGSTLAAYTDDGRVRLWRAN